MNKGCMRKTGVMKGQAYKIIVCVGLLIAVGIMMYALDGLLEDKDTLILGSDYKKTALTQGVEAKD